MAYMDFFQTHEYQAAVEAFYAESRYLRAAAKTLNVPKHKRLDMDYVALRYRDGPVIVTWRGSDGTYEHIVSRAALSGPPVIHPELWRVQSRIPMPGMIKGPSADFWGFVTHG